VTADALTRIDPPEFATRRDHIVALESIARSQNGHDALGDSVWRDLAHPGADSAGFLVPQRAYVHVARSESGDPSSWAAGIIRLPDTPDDAAVTQTLAAAVAHVARRGGRLLTCWVFGATDNDNAPFSSAGFQPDRTLYEMRAPLPIAASAALPSGITVRTFEPGRDNADWISVNNRAFGDHAEQGGWDEATLRSRITEPWFDPTLFLLAFDSKGLAGFNWLKRHEPGPPDPALGEIYVIGIDPRTQGSGLGRALAIAGLQTVSERGLTVASLFVAGDNTAAIALYRSLGFTVHRTDRAYVCPIEAP
jgi:mycothiol synthase